MKVCSSCGNTIPDTSKFCPKCGAKMTAGDDQKQETKTAKKTGSKSSKAVGIDDLTAATLKPLLCAQCQSPLQPSKKDWENGYTTCPACGTQTVLSGHAKIAVEYDNSKQLKAHLNLANRAWSAKNYDEALEYYTKVLENAPGNIVAMYRKGICSFYVNGSVSEFQINIVDASDLLSNQLSQLRDIPKENKSEEDRKFEEDCKELAKLMGKEIYSLLNSLADSANFPPDLQRSNDLILLDKMECEKEINYWLIVAQLYYISSAYVLNLGYKEKILHDGALFIDRILNSKVYYQTRGYDRRGNYTVENIQCKIPQSNLSSLFDMHRKMTKMYNNLPAQKAEEERLHNEMDKIQKEGERLSAKLKQTQSELEQTTNQFWETNPDMKNRRTLQKALPWLVVLIGVIFAVISIFVHWLLYGIIVLVVAIIVAIILGVPVYRSFEESALPPEVKELQKSLAATEEEYSKNQQLQDKKQKEIGSFDEKKELRA